MARQLGQSQNFKCCGGFLVYSAQYLPKVLQGRTSREPVSDRIMGTHRSAIVELITWKGNASWDRKELEHTTHHRFLHSCRPVVVPMLRCGHCQKCLQWACIRTMEQQKKVTSSVDSLVYHLCGEKMASGCTTGGRQACERSANFWATSDSCRRYFEHTNIPKHCWKQSTPLHVSDIPWWQWSFSAG